MYGVNMKNLACAIIAALMLVGIIWFIGNVLRPQIPGLADNIYIKRSN
jgi:hypothetical protein